MDTTELELEVKAKEKEVTCLLEDVERLQNGLKQLRETSGKQVTLLESQLESKKHALSVLEERLKNQEDYDEIKKELRCEMESNQALAMFMSITNVII